MFDRSLDKAKYLGFLCMIPKKTSEFTSCTETLEKAAFRWLMQR